MLIIGGNALSEGCYPSEVFMPPTLHYTISLLLTRSENAKPERLQLHCSRSDIPVAQFFTAGLFFLPIAKNSPRSPGPQGP